MVADTSVLGAAGPGLKDKAAKGSAKQRLLRAV